MTEPLVPLPPIYTAGLLPTLEGLLLDLLRSLDTSDWDRPTIAGSWKVRDVAAHLLDTHLRKLSICRDGHALKEGSAASRSDLATLVNKINQEGVNVYRRLSPKLLTEMMEIASRESAEYHASLDPLAPAIFPVSWAGETQSANWFDTAREYTERWHHQQQIRVAVDRPGIMTRELYHPVLDCFMRALPHTYFKVEADPGTLVQVHVSGESGGSWYLCRTQYNWALSRVPAGTLTAEITIPQSIAWRVFTKGISQSAAKAQVTLRGKTALAKHVLGAVAIVA
jgi:uncharacterized protein (TIGR03083 family)